MNEFWEFSIKSENNHLSHLFQMYPLKRSENLILRVFLCFQGVEKGCIGSKWDNERIEKNVFTQFTIEIFKSWRSVNIITGYLFILWVIS